MRHGPALRSFDLQRRRAPRAAFAHHELAVRAQVTHRHRAPEPMQRIIRMGDEQHAEPHQRIAGESLRDRAEDREVHAPFEQRLDRAAHHRLDQLDVRLRAFRAKFVETFEHQPHRE